MRHIIFKFLIKLLALFTFYPDTRVVLYSNVKYKEKNIITSISEKPIFKPNTFNNYIFAENTWDISLLITSMRSWVDILILFLCYFKDCIYYIMDFPKYYRVFFYFIQENRFKPLPIFAIFIYYYVMYFFRNYLFSLVFLYIFCTIVAYCFPFFLGVLYVLSSIFLLFSSISLFTYINYINLDFKKKHTYLYYLLFALYITLAATLFILLAKYAINHIDL